MSQTKTLQEKIARAKQLLDEIHHVGVATVNSDGSPHDSPVFMAFDDKLNSYWVSHPSSQHSQNIARDARVFMAVFDSREGHGGLFIEARAHALEGHDQATAGYEALSKLKERFYGTMGDIGIYTSKDGQRIYRAEPVRFWVNKSERDQSGAIISDRRYEITLDELLQ